MATLYGTPSGKAILARHRRKGNTVTIVPTADANGYCSANNQADAMNPAKGSSSKVSWNPSYSIPSDPTSTPTIMLGHELVHAYHNGTGTARNGPHDSYAGQTGTSEPRRGACDRRHVAGRRWSRRTAPSSRCRITAATCRPRIQYATTSALRAGRHIIRRIGPAGRRGSIDWPRRQQGCSVALLAFLLAIRLSWGMNMHAQNGDIQLSAEVSLAADRLVLSYRIENAGGADVYLVNKVYKALPKAEIDKDFAYVFLTEQGELAIEKDIPPVPQGLSPTSLVVPYMSVVRAGASFTETVELPVPVRQYIEYLDNTPPADPQQGARRRRPPASSFRSATSCGRQEPRSASSSNSARRSCCSRTRPGHGPVMKSWWSDRSGSRFPSTPADQGRDVAGRARPPGRRAKLNAGPKLIRFCLIWIAGRAHYLVRRSIIDN